MSAAREQEQKGIPGVFDILPDGTVARSEFITPNIPASETPGSECRTRDVLVHRDTGLEARLFLPHSKGLDKPLPVIVYLHGGSFCMCSAKTVFIHNFCVQVAKATNALVISLDYRLAPEHRLPAAYKDGLEVLEWLADHHRAATSSSSSVLEPWILNHADFSRCFLMGESSGANILYSVIARAPHKSLPVSGLIFVHPFFGGEERTASELRFAKEDYASPVELNDEFWRYSLPPGADRDHPYSNPFKEESVVRALPEVEVPRSLVVIGGGRNSLLDRQVEFFNLLKKSNKDVVLLFLKNAPHAFEFLPAHIDEANVLLQVILQFIDSKSDPKLTRSAC